MGDVDLDRNVTEPVCQLFGQRIALGIGEDLLKRNDLSIEGNARADNVKWATPAVDAEVNIEACDCESHSRALRPSGLADSGQRKGRAGAHLVGVVDRAEKEAQMGALHRRK